MNSIIRILIFIPWVIGLLHISAYAEDVSITPNEIKKTDTVRISKPTLKLKETGIVTPSGKFIELYSERKAHSPYFINYLNAESISFPVIQLKGRVWKEGKPMIVPVFTQAGVYEFYFADNLETEPESTNHHCVKVYFDTKKTTSIKPSLCIKH